MKKLRLLLFAPLLMAFQCDEDIDWTKDQLFDSGIIGAWEFRGQTINGISDMLPPRYRLLDFQPDGNPNDHQGEFTLEETSSNLIGTFVLNMDEQTIIFSRENRDDLTYNYTLNAQKDELNFSYIEGNAQFVDTWSKQY